MKKIIIIGAGAHAAELEGYILENNALNPEIQIIGYLDDSEENYKNSQLLFPLLGGIFNYTIPPDVELILALNGISIRTKVINYFTEKNIKFSNFIHHTSRVFRTAQIGVGNIFCPYTQVGPNVVIGNYNSFNNMSSIGHNSVIGNNNIFNPNTGLSGNTIVGHSNFFSLNVVTIPNIVIGDNNVIAPNMVIEKNIQSNSTFFHRYKEVVLVVPKEN